MEGNGATHSTPDAAAEMTAVSWPRLRRRFRDAGLLQETVRGENAPDPDDFTIDHLADDSRMVRPEGAFVAIRGVDADGHSFIDMAVDKGARLVVCETVPEDARARHSGAVFARVTSSRAALAEAASALYGDPADALTLIGVTGTNGKTTVAFLMHHVLESLGVRTGLLSTVEVRAGTEVLTPDLTTPGPLTLHRSLRTMVDAGCAACAMEVSSHALDQDRVHGLDFAEAIFTNLTVDHLNYHGSPAAYRTAKKKLFDGLAADAYAVVNADDDASSEMVADTDASVVSFAIERPADVEATVLESRVDGLRLRIDARERAFRLAGRFNASNLTAAYAAALSLGHDPEVILDGLSEAPPVPGRFEQLRFEDGTTVIVDYAHTPDALDNLLQTVRETVPEEATLWCVFGCGGDRDPSKRRTMGAIAERYADEAIVTSDNPRSEDPQAILQDIREGVTAPEAMRWIVDREDAIRVAARESAPGDVVVIAGKGHETTQTIGDETRPFDDRKIARKHFSR